MIPSIIIISIAFYWLLLETNWLTIRLMIGEPTEYKRKSWLELKPWHTNKNDPMWLRWPELMTPLCGLDWLENTMHVIPEYKIELNTGGVKYNMTIKKDSVLKDVMRVNKLTKKQKLAYI